MSTIKMKSKSNFEARSIGLKSSQGEGPNWVLIVGGALLSTLSIRLGFKLKQTFDCKQKDDTILKGKLFLKGFYSLLNFIICNSFRCLKFRK